MKSPDFAEWARKLPPEKAKGVLEGFAASRGWRICVRSIPELDCFRLDVRDGEASPRYTVFAETEAEAGAKMLCRLFDAAAGSPAEIEIAGDLYAGTGREINHEGD